MMQQDEKQQAGEALAMIKGVYDDGSAEINGRQYQFTEMRHKKRVSVFAFYTSVQAQLRQGNLAFLDTPQFNHVFGVMCDHIMFEDMLLSKLPDHFEKHPSDYILLVQTALGVMSYPFLPESALNTTSPPQAETAKPMSKKVI